MTSEVLGLTFRNKAYYDLKAILNRENEPLAAARWNALGKWKTVRLHIRSMFYYACNEVKEKKQYFLNVASVYRFTSKKVTSRFCFQPLP